MGILANTVTICHFKVRGEFTQHDDRPFFEFAHELLARKGFTPIDETLDELSLGWVHLDDSKQSHFTSAADCWRDRYLVFSLRRDQRKIPAALLKEHFEKACAEFLNENPGFTRVPKQKREDLKDAVRSKLLAKALPDPKVYDVVWDTQSGDVTFTTLSPKTVELLEHLFKQTFEGLRLTAHHPYERAMGCLDSNWQRFLIQANKASGDSYLELIKENRWIGCDFMLWLLYQTMNEASEYRVNQPGPMISGELFTAFINDKVVLCGEGENGAQMITVNGPQDNFYEVRSALQGRKAITEATIHLEAADEKWCLTLKGELFHFAALSSPAVRIEKDSTVDEHLEREAVFFERMLLLDKGLQIFNSLFATFLRARLVDTWGVAEAKITDWIIEG